MTKRENRYFNRIKALKGTNELPVIAVPKEKLQALIDQFNSYTAADMNRDLAKMVLNRL